MTNHTEQSTAITSAAEMEKLAGELRQHAVYLSPIGSFSGDTRWQAAELMRKAAGAIDALRASRPASALPTDSSEVERLPDRFSIKWERGAYYVSIPNYKGGDVVPAETADTLKATIAQMREALSQCRDLFWDIRNDWSDPRSECHEGSRIIDAALSSSPAPAVEKAGTPGALWRAKGEPDPHDDRYDCERAKLAGGNMTDDEVANAVFLDPSMTNLTIAKDRIRWLSRKLATPTRSAEMSAEDMREAAAAIADNEAQNSNQVWGQYDDDGYGQRGYEMACDNIATAIRALPTTAVSGESNG